MISTLAHSKRPEPHHSDCSIIDTDEGLDIETVGDADDIEISTMAAAMVEAIYAEGTLTTRALRECVKPFGGSRVQSAAMELLEHEVPRRVKVEWDVVDTGRGRQRAKVWRSASPELFSHEGGIAADSPTQASRVEPRGDSECPTEE